MCVATIGSQEERAAWVSHELGRKQVCLGPYPIRVARGKSPQKAEQSQHGTREPFYRSGDKTMAVETSTAPSFARARHGQLFEGHAFRPRLDPDGQTHVVLNWTEELMPLVPAGK